MVSDIEHIQVQPTSPRMSQDIARRVILAEPCAHHPPVSGRSMQVGRNAVSGTLNVQDPAPTFALERPHYPVDGGEFL